MAPLTFVGIGWLMLVLALLVVAGPIGFTVGTVGIAVLLVGLARIRWRNQVLTWTFYAGIALFVSHLAVLAGLPGGLALGLLLAGLQTGIAAGLATGVRACLTGDGDDARPAARLGLARTLILAMFAVTVAGAAVARAGAELPGAAFVLLAMVFIGVNAWLAVLMIQLREHPSLQEHPSGR